jgi:hypothetical protein
MHANASCNVSLCVTFAAEGDTPNGMEGRALILVPVAPRLAHLGMDESSPRIPAGLTVALSWSLGQPMCGGFYGSGACAHFRHWEKEWDVLAMIVLSYLSRELWILESHYPGPQAG